MDTPVHLEKADGYACYRPVGQVSLQQAINLISVAITHAREQQITHLLIDALGLTGFDSPTTLDRYTFGGEFARASHGAVKFALIVKNELIDPKKFGVTVARNRGLIVEVFTTEAEALAWLLGSDPK